MGLATGDPSVWRKEGWCLVCFRPALICQPRRTETYEILLRASQDGYNVSVQTIQSLDR